MVKMGRKIYSSLPEISIRYLESYSHLSLPFFPAIERMSSENVSLLSSNPLKYGARSLSHQDETGRIIRRNIAAVNVCLPITSNKRVLAY